MEFNNEMDDDDERESDMRWVLSMFKNYKTPIPVIPRDNFVKEEEIKLISYLIDVDESSVWF